MPPNRVEATANPNIGLPGIFKIMLLMIANPEAVVSTEPNATELEVEKAGMTSPTAPLLNKVVCPGLYLLNRTVHNRMATVKAIKMMFGTLQAASYSKYAEGNRLALC